MTLTITILSLITAAVPLIIWYVKRKQSPSLEEQLFDNAEEFERLRAELVAARGRGDDAGAESVLRRLRTRAGVAERNTDAPGQRGADGLTGGHGAGAAEPGGK